MNALFGVSAILRRTMAQDSIIMKKRLSSEIYDLPSSYLHKPLGTSVTLEGRDYYQKLDDAINNSTSKLETKDLLGQLGRWAPHLDHCIEVLKANCSIEEFQGESINCTAHKRIKDSPFWIRQDQTICAICNGSISEKAMKIVTHCRNRVGTEFLIFGVLLAFLLILFITGGVIVVGKKFRRRRRYVERLAEEAHGQHMSIWKYGGCCQKNERARTSLTEQPEFEVLEHSPTASAPDSATSNVNGSRTGGPLVISPEPSQRKVPKTVRFSEDV